MLQTDHSIRTGSYSKESPNRVLFSGLYDKIFFLIWSIYRNNTGLYGMETYVPSSGKNGNEKVILTRTYCHSNLQHELEEYLPF